MEDGWHGTLNPSWQIERPTLISLMWGFQKLIFLSFGGIVAPLVGGLV